MFKELPVNSSIMTDLLDSYVVGNLPESVKLWVDERLAEDAYLRQELEMHRLAIAALRDCGKKENSDFGNALAKISKEELNELLSELRQVQEEPAAASAIQKPRAHVFKAWMWKTMAAAAVLGGVWLGTRSFYKGQTAQAFLMPSICCAMACIKKPYRYWNRYIKRVVVLVTWDCFFLRHILRQKRNAEPKTCSMH